MGESLCAVGVLTRGDFSEFVRRIQEAPIRQPFLLHAPCVCSFGAAMGISMATTVAHVQLARPAALRLRGRGAGGGSSGSRGGGRRLKVRAVVRSGTTGGDGGAGGEGGGGGGEGEARAAEQSSADEGLVAGRA